MTTANEAADAKRVREILAEVKRLAAEYYRLTGKPLGVTGEVAESIAADLLNLELVPPRTEGYDAIRRTENGIQHIQIKGRAYGDNATPSQRMGTIKKGAACDSVVLVLMDNKTLDPREIWEAPMTAVDQRLLIPGSRARDRGALGVREFKKMAKKVWPAG